MREKYKDYIRLQRLLAMGFFVSGIVPIILIAAGSIYNFKQLSINNIEMTARQVAEKIRFGMGGEEGLDLLFHDGQVFAEGAYLV